MDKSEFKIKKTVVELILNDITEMDTDAIVNAANSYLLGVDGVDGSIHQKGGSNILDECKEIRSSRFPKGLPTGQAVLTSAGNLKSKFVIHTVGPIWKGGFHHESELLEKAYLSSLNLAFSKGISSISFPSISTGAYNYPAKEASIVALRTIRNFVVKQELISKVVMVLFSKKTYKIYLATAEEILK
jgi:O-acetyl-ADP-ribose deacetylase (regulator of RNase III)